MKLLPLIYNPAARGGRSRLPRAELAAVAEGFGFHLELWPTQEPGHATRLAGQAREGSCPAVAVWGGDGTYNEVAAGLLNSSTALLPLPGGTTSVLVYELGLPRKPAEALAAQLSGQQRKLYVGRTDRGQIFLFVLSAGPDSLILYHLPWRLKRYGGKLGIALQAVAEFFRARLPLFEVHINGQRLQAGWCILGNGRFYAGPFPATPGADPFRPGFQAVLQTRSGRRAAVPFFFGIPFGRHLRQKGVQVLTGQKVTLQGEGRIPYQLDGDPAGFLPVTATAGEDFVLVQVPEPVH
jgi:diacylglycerol kinase family enzyme